MTKKVIIMKIKFVFLCLVICFSFLSVLADDKSDPNASYRGYYPGVIPTVKEGNISYQKEAYIEAGQLGEYSLVVLDVPWYNLTDRYHSTPIKLGIIQQRIKLDGGMKPILQTNFWNLSQVSGMGLMPSLHIPSWMPSNTTMNYTIFIEEWVDHCVNLTESEKPDYFILSKEVNDFWGNDSNPNAINNTFSDFLKLCKNSTDTIHQVSPNTKTIIEFRMPTLVARNQRDLVEQVNSSHCDVVGFTSYPYLLGDPLGTQYPSPQNLSENYYTKILNYTSLPIAFTEIGWSSSNITNLTKNFNFSGTEKKQADYVNIFFEEMNKFPEVELVNWLFLHDTAPKGNETRAQELVGLKYYNGTKKLAYNIWDLISNRSYLNKSEVSISIAGIQVDMTEDYSAQNITIIASKSYAAMYWSVEAISDNNATYYLSDKTKSNSTSFLITNQTFPQGKYTLKLVGSFDNITKNWTFSIPIETEPTDFLLSSDTNGFDSDGNFNLSWTQSIFADNYSIYVWDHCITKINSSLTRLEKGLEDLNYSIIGYSNGTYFFAVVAFNNFSNVTSNCINITLDATKPQISIISPKNMTYNTSAIKLQYTIDEKTSWIKYSLNNNENISLTANISLLNLINGTYHLVLYMSDLSGNVNSKEVYFTIVISGGATKEEDESDDGGFLGICGPTILIGLILLPAGFLSKKFKK